MRIRVHFYSYFKEMTGCSQAEQVLGPEATVGDLVDTLYARFPKLSSMSKSTLVAVGVEYQPRNYRLKEGDEVSLFPPVQGG
jgi:MoaD family protein